MKYYSLLLNLKTITIPGTEQNSLLRNMYS